MKQHITVEQLNELSDKAQMKVCKVCSKNKVLSEYYRSGKGNDGHHSMCKDCTYDYKKAKGLMVGKSNYANTLRWRKKNRNKTWAHQTLNDWIRDGRIIKPTRCYTCGEPAELEAHHDDYRHPLRVSWLCTRCHGSISRRPLGSL